MYTDWKSLFPLLELRSPELWRELMRQNGPEKVYAGILGRTLCAYYLGHAVKGGLRNRFRKHALGQLPPPNRPSADQRFAITAANFERKDLADGPDNAVLRAIAKSGWNGDRGERKAHDLFPPVEHPIPTQNDPAPPPVLGGV